MMVTNNAGDRSEWLAQDAPRGCTPSPVSTWGNTSLASWTRAVRDVLLSACGTTKARQLNCLGKRGEVQRDCNTDSQLAW